MKTRNPRKYRSMFFICGSFMNQEEDDHFQVLWASPSPSRKPSRNQRFCCIGNKENKNPYSNCGIDKFEALLADLDAKKRKIFTQKGSQYISFVRFMYSNSKGMKPIIVRLKDPRKHDHKDHDIQNNFKVDKSSLLLDHHKDQELQEDVTNDYAKKIRVDHQWKLNLKKEVEEWWMPSYNLQFFVIMVMVFFTFFGRSLAIICTSIAWYLIPTIDHTSLENTMAKPKKMIKNQHSRKASEMKVLSSPKPFFSGPNVKQTNRMKKLMSF